MISVKNLVISFGSKTVINNISFNIKKGEKVAILGPSGEGKSVLLRTILGLIKPTSGEIIIENMNVYKSSEETLNNWRKKIGILFQGSALFDFMTVEENIAFPLLVHTDDSLEQKKEKVDKALSMVRLQGTNNIMPDELSGGMQKRVALARGIVSKPQYMFYDEPTSGLDPVRARIINELISDLNNKLNLTSITITHDMASLDIIATKILFMKHSKIAFFGTIEESKQHEELQDFIHGKGDVDLV